jgi:hypothetical protein
MRKSFVADILYTHGCHESWGFIKKTLPKPILLGVIKQKAQRLFNILNVTKMPTDLRESINSGRARSVKVDRVGSDCARCDATRLVQRCNRLGNQ